jgi:hypothetical protein
MTHLLGWIGTAGVEIVFLESFGVAATRYQGMLVRPNRCAIRLTRNRTMKMKKQILAISAAAKATTPKPSRPATRAITRKINE